MRDFNWFDELYCVVKDDGSFAGKPCLTIEEAIELSANHKHSQIFKMKWEKDALSEYEEE